MLKRLLKFVDRKKVILVLILILILVSFLQSTIDRQPEMQEIRRTNPFETLPPTEYLGAYISGIVLGGFKPLIVNYLWIKMDQLKEDLQFYEIRTLANLIARLQPKNHEVWKFNAHNMAYNISKQQETLEAQWLWVNNGIKYLQEGLSWNPNHLQLLKELAFFYYHRIPQESYLMQQVEKEHQRDCYEVAETWTFKQKHILQKQEKDPYECEFTIVYCRAHHAFELIKKELFNKAIDALQNLADYCKQISRTYNREIKRWEREYEAYLALAELIKTEKTVAVSGQKDRKQFLDLLPALLFQYKNIINRYQKVLFMKPLNERIETLFLEYIYQTYELIEQSEFEEVRMILEKAIQNVRKTTPDNPEHLAMYFFQALQERFLSLGKLAKTEQALGPSINSHDSAVASSALETIVKEYEKYISAYRDIFNIAREYERYQYLDKMRRKQE